ncbi:MAG: polysaccharide deacetylase family protein [Hyphomicrobiaceae bacterium]
MRLISRLALVGALSLQCASQHSVQAGERADLQAMCWSPSALANRASEIAPRSGIAAARVSQPRQQLAAFNELPDGLRGVIRRVNVNDGRKLVALTFDLCEQSHEVSGYDGRVVDVLRKLKVRATFFASGKWLLTHDERTAQLMTDPLFEIANHSWSHRNLKRLSGGQLQRQILSAQRAYEVARQKLGQRACIKQSPEKLASVPQRMGLFRYPFGTCRPEAIKAVNDNGLLAVQWDISTGDPWRGQSAKAIVRTVMSRVRPGSIVVAHANGRGWNTASALPVLIKRLRLEGYELVTVSELLAAGVPEIVKSCYNERIGDTDLWAQAGTRAGARKKRARRSKKVRRRK